MNKKLSIVLIVLLSVLLASVICGMVFLFHSDFKFDKFNFSVISFTSGTSTKLVDSKEISDIKSLDIQSDTADVSILTSDSNTIKVELYSDNLGEHEITELDDSIRVVLMEKDKVKWGFGKKINYIKIYVPMNYALTFNINGTTGDVKIDDFSSANLNLSVTTGDVEIK